MDAPDRHNGQTDRQTNKRTCLFIRLCLGWSLTLSGCRPVSVRVFMFVNRRRFTVLSLLPRSLFARQPQFTVVIIIKNFIAARRSCRGICIRAVTYRYTVILVRSILSKWSTTAVLGQLRYCHFDTHTHTHTHIFTLHVWPARLNWQSDNDNGK